MGDATETRAVENDEDFIELVGRLMKEAVQLTFDNASRKAELRSQLENFIASVRGAPMVSTTIAGEEISSGSPVTAKTASELAIVSYEPPSSELATAVDFDVVSTPEGLALVPSAPQSAETKGDPTRPDFGPNQVSSPDNLRAGTKLRVRGAKNAKLECHNEDDISVKDIVDPKNNPRGEVTVVSSPFDTTLGGRKVIIVSYDTSTFFGNKMTRTSRIFLDNLSVTQYQPKRQNDPGAWRVDVWLEWVPSPT